MLSISREDLTKNRDADKSMIANKIINSINEKILAKSPLFIRRITLKCEDFVDLLGYDKNDFEFIFSEGAGSEIVSAFYEIYLQVLRHYTDLGYEFTTQYNPKRGEITIEHVYKNAVFRISW